MDGVVWTNPASRILPEPVDHFDRLPDSLLLLVFNKIGDVKALGQCCVVSRRFLSLVPQVENVVVRVDCVISEDESSSSSSSSSASDKSRSPFFNLFRFVFSGLVKPLQALGQLFGTKRTQFNHNSQHFTATAGSASHGGSGFCGESSSGSRTTLSVGSSNSSIADDEEMDQGGVTHHSPTQVLKNFNEIRFLRIDLPSGELGIDDGVLLKWRADFGSTLDNCVILGAASVMNDIHAKQQEIGAADFPSVSHNNYNNVNVNVSGIDDNGRIPESFYTNGGLKLRVVWTISSLIAASARHYLLQPIIGEHKTLDSLILTDSDGQGVLCMNREQLEELRVKPLSASSASKRKMVPALNMRLWYAPCLELPDGVVLKGATLVAIRPSDRSATKEELSDGPWLGSAFEEPYGTAAKMLVKRRTYCLELNSF